MPFANLDRRVAQLRAPLALKLQAGFLLLIALLVATGAISLLAIASIRQQAMELDKLDTSVALALGLDHSIVVQEHLSSMFVLTADEGYSTKLRAEHARFRGILAQLAASGVAERDILGIAGAFARYEGAAGTVMTLKRAGDERQAQDIHVAQEHVIAHEIEALTKSLAGRMKERRQAGQSEMLAAQTRATWRVVGFFVFFVGLALALGSILARSILHPVRRVDAALERIAQGEFVSVSDVVNRDELGSLVANLNRTSQRLADLYARERLTAHELQEQLVALRRTQAQLREAQKMEAIGRLAGGIAHDFNNLLMVISGRTQFLLRDLSPNDSARRHAELVKKTTDRATSLTQQLLAFSRRQVLQPRVLDLNELMGGIVPMLRLLVGEHINLITVLDPGLGRVKADPTQIEQVVLNLAVNARDAMPGGGTLTIQTANGELEENLGAQEAPQPGPHVMLVVRDTGVGMSTETQTHLFEPFFTTKGPGKGTGLGLATVYGIVKQSGGNISVFSEPGQGTAITIWLPRVEARADALLSASVASEPPKGRETILLAEDEDGVRDLAREVLEGYGYTVLEARDGEEALRQTEQHQGPLHLVLTDVVMPRMGGRELAKCLMARYPDVKVIYMSGYTDDALSHHGVLDPGLALLQKPFDAEVLGRKVREVLRAAPSESTPQ